MSPQSIWDQASVTVNQFGSNGSYTNLSTIFNVAADKTLDGIWFYSPGGSGLTDLPIATAIFEVGNTTPLTSNASPSWSGAVGSGWVKTTNETAITLTAGTDYIVSILGPSAPAGVWMAFDNVSVFPVTNGDITAPASSGSLTNSPYTDASGSSTIAYPTSSTAITWYVDVSLNDASSGVTGTIDITLKKMTVSGTGASGSAYDVLILTDSPIAYWPLTETVGTTTIVDASGNGHDGTLIGVTMGASSPAVPSGMDGTSSSWPGSGAQDMVVTGYRPSLSAATWEFWLNRDSMTQGGSNPRIWGNGPGPSGFDIFLNGGTDPFLRTSDGTTSYLFDTGASIPSSPAWRHCVFTYDGSELRFYLDGVLTGTPVAASGTIPPSPTSTDYMHFGGNFPWQSPEEFAGLFSRAALYDTALTQAQILAHYEAGAEPQTLFGQPSMSLVAQDDATAYTLAMEFELSQDAPLSGIWFYSPSGSGATNALPVGCGIINLDTSTVVSGTENDSPSWSGAAGSGWVKCVYDQSVTLAAGTKYAVGIHKDTAEWVYAATSHYWDGSGDGASGLTNGIISAPNSVSSVLGQDSFFTGGSTITIPDSSFNATNYWIDVEVIVPPSAGGVTGTADVTLKKMTVSGSGSVKVTGTGAVTLKKMTVSGTGSTFPSFTFNSTDGNGIDTYTALSGTNNTSGGVLPVHVRVLEPTSPNTAYPHSFLLMLPVEPDQNSTFGDPMSIAVSETIPDTYNLTVVQPGYATDPWYADNADDPSTLQETFTLDVVTWLKANFATTGNEHVYLIGFSKSGVGGQQLILRNPSVFDACMSWDFPIGDLIATFGADPTAVYGDETNLTNNYELSSANLDGWKTPFQSTNRLWIGGFASYQSDVDSYDTLLTSKSMLHTYTYQVSESHAWHADWVDAALSDTIVANPNAGAVTLKKMTAAASGGVKVTGTAAITMRKMFVSGSGHAPLLGTGSVTLKKMTASSSGSVKVIGVGSVTMRKMVIHGTNIPLRKTPSLFIFSFS